MTTTKARATASVISIGALLISGMVGPATAVPAGPLTVPANADVVITVAGATYEPAQSVASAGDVNGDGVDDIILGAVAANPNGTHSGAAYVVYGKSGGPQSPMAAPSDLDPATTGFRVDGPAAGRWAGHSVSGTGDVNGDGFDDVVVGAPIGGSAAANSGDAYVIYGRSNANAQHIDLADPLVPSATGFQIAGGAIADAAGFSVNGAGDVNDDGLDDVIVGVPFADSAGPDSGSTFVIFGQRNANAADIDLAGSLNPATTGISIVGAAAEDVIGWSVSGAGDVNGDGIADVVIGAPFHDVNVFTPDAGAAYIVFGKPAGQMADIDLADGLDPATSGVSITGANEADFFGIAVANAGDVNDDDHDDIVAGAVGMDVNGLASGGGYVVYGQSSAGAANINLTTPLDPAQTGFRIVGGAESDNTGQSVAGVGDFNLDGLDDVIIGAPQAGPNGIASGSAFVVYGKGDADAANVDLSHALPATTGLRINGSQPDDASGFAVTGAGDITGRGSSDILIGSPRSPTEASGSVFAIFGTAPKPPPPPIIRTAQSQFPVRTLLPRRGAHVVNPVRSVTRQGRPLTARVVARSPQRCARVAMRPGRRMAIHTTGICRRVHVTVRYSATGNERYLPYVRTIVFRTRSVTSRHD